MVCSCRHIRLAAKSTPYAPPASTLSPCFRQLPSGAMPPARCRAVVLHARLAMFAVVRGARFRHATPSLFTQPPSPYATPGVVRRRHTPPGCREVASRIP
ncbi:hypothetical protein NPIL_468021 [Nephila pilipes]|uniref:Uncharacterized protein n=1 Tax=Nephila pilipes TaxID=299642 RepID=A0A8X6NY44_NEPPI|nr:hypothetical protein NPIL_468021 [Nephila pilipes]